MTAGRGNHRARTTNAPGSSPEPAPDNISEQSLMHRLRGLGIDIQAAPNAALHDLTKAGTYTLL